MALEAIASIEDAKQKCMAVGQRLNEIKEKCEHGDFLNRLKNCLPEISSDSANRWMRAAANIIKALPPAPIDIEVSISTILATADKELTADQRKYKQDWFDFTENKTIKECLNSVTVYGDDAHRVDRAINGKTKGGIGKQKDRKAFEKFTAEKLRHITTFLTLQKKSVGTGKKKVCGWRKISPVQQTQIGAAFNVFWETAPQWLLEVCADKIKTESKLNDGERLAR